MYRRRGLSNLLKMGHCAPTIMQTLLDLGNTKEEWLVKVAAKIRGIDLIVLAGLEIIEKPRIWLSRGLLLSAGMR
jgi:hypothetical protein